MTDAQAALAQVREALAAGPTPGEWRYIVDDGDRKLTAAGASGAFMRDTTYYPWCPDNEGDWKLMAACSPANMTAILAHVEAQAAEIERLTAALRAQPGAVNMDDVEWAGKVHLQDAQQEIERLHAVAQHEADCVDAYRAQIERLTAERDDLRRQLDPMGEFASADELIAALRAEKAEDEAMKRDAECWRELDRMMSDPDARLNVNAGGWAVLTCGLLGKLGGDDA